MCETGWVGYLDNCYFFAHGARVTYSGAKSGCSNKHSRLVTINNQAEHNFLAGK